MTKTYNVMGHVGTYAWAAEQLGVSVNQVRRYVADGIIGVATPRAGKHEMTRKFPLVADVDKLREARKVIRRG